MNVFDMSDVPDFTRDEGHEPVDVTVEEITEDVTAVKLTVVEGKLTLALALAQTRAPLTL